VARSDGDGGHGGASARVFVRCTVLGVLDFRTDLDGVLSHVRAATVDRPVSQRHQLLCAPFLAACSVVCTAVLMTVFSVSKNNNACDPALLSACLLQVTVQRI
jgi:hypothetical protein